MKYKLVTIFLIILITFCGCNSEKMKTESTKVELNSEHVVMGVMCRYQYSNEINGEIDVLLVYADGRICTGTCPKEIEEIYSEFWGKLHGDDISVWSVLEDVEEVACLSKEEMEVLIEYTQSIDLESENTGDTSEEPQPKPAVEDIFNSYIYFCYQWDKEYIPTYFPIKWSHKETLDENALAALEFLLQNKTYQEWYDTCQQITWDATHN